MAEQVIACQGMLARRPDDAAAWLALGDTYADMAASIAERTFRPLSRTQQETLGLLRSFVLQVVALLEEMAADSYQQAVSFSGDGATARYRLASIHAAMGDYGQAARILETISQPPLDRAGDPVPMASLWSQLAILKEKERHPFTFLDELREKLIQAGQGQETD